MAVLDRRILGRCAPALVAVRVCPMGAVERGLFGLHLAHEPIKVEACARPNSLDLGLSKT